MSGGLASVIERAIVQACGVARPSRHSAAPLSEPSLLLGYAEDRQGRSTPVRQSRRAQAMHTLIQGGSGSGKSVLAVGVLFQQLVKQRMRSGAPGLAIIDPHGETAELALEILGRIAEAGGPEVLDHVDLIDPLASRVLGWNPLRIEHTQSAYNQIATFADIVRSFSEHGPRMSEVLHQGLMLASAAGLTLVEVSRLLHDAGFRQSLYAGADCGAVEYWRERFDPQPATTQRQMVEPVLNRLQQILGDERLRVMLGQPSGLSFRSILDAGRIVIVTLPKGLLRDSPMLANLLFAQLYHAALSRADLPPKQRRQFVVMLEEFESFLIRGSCAAEAASEIRKFGVSLVCIFQFMGQLDAYLRQSVLANFMTFAVGKANSTDARIMVEEIAPLQRESHYRRLLTMPPRQFLVTVRGELAPTILHVPEIDTTIDQSRVARVRETILRRYPTREQVLRDIKRRQRPQIKIATDDARAVNGNGSHEPVTPADGQFAMNFFANGTHAIGADDKS